MKIYYSCSTAEFSKYKRNYFAIRDFLVSEKHILTHDWLDQVDLRIKNKIPEIRDIKKIYQQCKDGINEADLVIIEDTISNFSTGHQITLAIQRKKPTLVLWSEQKHRHFKQMFIHGVDSDALETKLYNLKNFKPIIREFINRYENSSTKNRFHLVLTNDERAYLDWMQYSNGKSRTKVIRELIKESIDQNKDYKSYLSRRS